LPTKAEVLAELTKNQLKKLCEDKGIVISKAWSKDELCEEIAKNFTKDEVRRLVARYSKIRLEEEVVEEEIKRKTVRRAMEAEGAQLVTEKVDVGKLLSLLERMNLGKQWVIDRIKDRGIRIPIKPGMTTYEILQECPESFVSYLRDVLQGPKMGIGLELRFSEWMKRNVSEVTELLEKFPDAVRIREYVTGASGVAHEVDVYVHAEPKRIMGITTFRGYNAFVECKDQKVDVDVVSGFRGVVEDICKGQSICPDRVIIVTSSKFTPAATKFAEHNPLKFEGLTWGGFLEETKEVPIELFEERELGQYVRIYPAEKKAQN
jgi:ribosomal protein L7Ae-like RNA K-turn-binding protein